MENTSESTITRRNSSNKRARSPEVSQSTWTIVGYEAKLFRRAALDLNEFLQSWRDHGVLLDRYDVRNLLDEQQLDAVRYTEKLGELTDSVKFAEEQELDSMRYHDLDSDEEVLFDMDAQEREQHVEEKRKRNKLADEGREFYYDYGDSNTNTHHDNEHIESDRMEQQRSSSADMISTRMNDHERAASITNAPLVTKPKVDAFTPTFSIPEGMIIPETKRLAEIIERTARYLNASTDPQLEILIKAKQAHNRDFAFLDTRHYLHEYYKHVRWIMASGLGDYASSNDDDDDDEHQSTCSSHYSDTEIEIPSDQELKQFIDRMAEFIARNGDDYEEQIRTNHSNPARLSFMDKTSSYRNYYRSQVKAYRKQLTSETTSDTKDVSSPDTMTSVEEDTASTTELDEIEQKKAERLAKARAWLARRKATTEQETT